MASLDVEITLSNYRSFGQSPGTFRIGPGYTAVVGPNNSGKTSFLRMFYELRDLFASLGAPDGTYVHLLPPGQGYALGVRGAHDHLEVFRGLERTLEIRLAFPDAGPNECKTARLVANRGPQQPICTLQLVMGDGRSVKGPFAGVGPTTLQGDASNPGSTDISVLVTAARQFANSVYIGAFRNAIHAGAKDYYDLSIGTKFIELWHSWQVGTIRQSYVIRQVIEQIRQIFRLSSLSITQAGETLHIDTESGPQKLGEMGAGLAQFIVTLGTIAIKQPDYVFIDEPELSLHPALQQEFLRAISSYTKVGVVFATHSIGLARALGQRVFVTRRSGSVSLVGLLGNIRNLGEFLGEMSFSSYNELGFSRLLLVEGPTDVPVFQSWLRQLSKDHKVVVMHVGGSSTINGNAGQQLSEVTRITPNISAIVDSERTQPGALPKDRADFEAVCKTLNIDVHLTDRRSTESYFTDAAVKGLLGASASALGPYDKAQWPNWSKPYNAKIAEGMTKADLLATDVGVFLAALPV
jgi:ABC-type branched-subunit amino acid transport system ATPase component